MPRVSRAQTDLNRAAIEDASARLFREQGLRGVSVSDLMAAAGLTHGGFYGHFDSKDTLAAIACAKAFEQSIARWKKRVDGKPDRHLARAALFDAYLSAQSRASPGTGCALAALAVDVAREPPGKPVHGAYLDGLDGLLEVLQGLQDPGGDEAHDRQLALGQLSTLVGAMVLARATRGQRISDEILAAAHASLDPGAGASAPPPRRRRRPAAP